MTSFYVRDTIRNWLQLGAIPYYDTVNQEQNPLDAQWCTVDWGFSFTERMNYCDDFLEDGSFNVVFFGPIGQGDSVLIPDAESDMELLMTRIDPTNRLTLMAYSAAEDFSDENYYGVSFNVEYEYQRP